MNLKKIGADAILLGITAPVIVGILFWFTSFVLSTYELKAEVTNQKDDLKEIKQDVKEVKKLSN